MVEIAHSHSSARPDALIWTKADQDAALQLGWGIFYDSERGWEIRRRNDDPRLPSDEAVQIQVIVLSGLEGRRRHLYDKALRIIEFRNPAEYERMIAVWQKRGGERLAA